MNKQLLMQKIETCFTVCPKCGVLYVAGGASKSITEGKSEYSGSDELFKDAKEIKNHF